MYCHYRIDTNEVFYIGKGQWRRAYSKQKRNNHWKNIVAKNNGFKVEILAKNLSLTESLNYERLLISSLRLKYPKLLCNLTDGGDGGLNPSEETRKKQAAAKRGRVLTEEHKQKISAGNKNRIVSQETKEKIRNAQLGRVSKFKGLKRSPEICLKISEAKKAKNYKHSEEAKAKMSAAKLKKRNI